MSRPTLEFYAWHDSTRVTHTVSDPGMDREHPAVFELCAMSTHPAVFDRDEAEALRDEINARLITFNREHARQDAIDGLLMLADAGNSAVRPCPCLNDTCASHMARRLAECARNCARARYPMSSWFDAEVSLEAAAMLACGWNPTGEVFP